MMFISVIRVTEKSSQLLNSEVELRKSKSSPSCDILSGSQAEVKVNLKIVTDNMNSTVVLRVWEDCRETQEKIYDNIR